jgi:hypothetical protein
MCIMGDTQPPFLTSITVVTGKADRASCPSGTNQSVDLNTGLNTGDTVYVCTTYTHESRAPTLVKDAIPVVGAIAACPLNYAKIPGDLNSGVLNAPTVSLCVLSKTTKPDAKPSLQQARVPFGKMGYPWFSQAKLSRCRHRHLRYRHLHRLQVYDPAAKCGPHPKPHTHPSRPCCDPQRRLQPQAASRYGGFRLQGIQWL